MALSWTLDKLGPLCQTDDDCGLVLEAIAVSDPNDPTTTNRVFKYDDSDVSSRRFRLGVLKGVADAASDPMRLNFERALKTLETVATIEEVEFSDLPHEAINRTIMFAEAANAFDEFVESGKPAELTAPEDRYGLYARVAVLAKDYIKALRLRKLMAVNADEVMSKFDALIAPTRFTTATPLDQEFRSAALHSGKDTMGAVGNGAGLPAISVPSGFSDEGLPTGIQFMGRAYDENAVLAVARAYQLLTDWHLQHPSDLID